MPIYIVRRRDKPRVYNNPKRLIRQLREDERRARHRSNEYVEPPIIEVPDNCRLLTIEELEHEILAE